MLQLPGLLASTEIGKDMSTTEQSSSLHPKVFWYLVFVHFSPMPWVERAPGRVARKASAGAIIESFMIVVEMWLNESGRVKAGDCR